MPTDRRLPTPPTSAEREGGLPPDRIAELVELGEELNRQARAAKRRLKCPDEIAEVSAVEAAAAVYEVKPDTLRRRFGDLARAAGWMSTTPEDFIGSRKTQAGGVRTGELRAGEGVSFGGRVRPETKAAVARARELLGLGLDGFLRRAADHVVAGHDLKQTES